MSTFSDRQYRYHLDSHQRISGSHHDGIYKIEFSDGSHITDYDRVVVLSATIPKSYYMIQAGLNTFQINENGTQYTVSLTPGTYATSSFLTLLQNTMNTSSASSGLGYTYSISFNNDTGIITYSITAGNPGFDPVYILSGNEVYEHLGLEQNTNNYFTSNVLDGTIVINLAPENNIFIRSDLVVSTHNNEDILQDIQASGVPDFAYIQFYQFELEGYSKSLNVNSNTFRFFLTNEDEGGDQVPLNTNGVNWTCTLLFYKRSTVYEKILDTNKEIVKNLRFLAIQNDKIIELFRDLKEILSKKK